MKAMIQENFQHKTALAGKPNSGKSSLFNALSGLNQKVGNFAGVTVDKASGWMSLPNGVRIPLIDLPGTYSLFPKSEDEAVTTRILTRPQGTDYPDRVIVVADASALRNSLLLCTQIIDTGIPALLVVNMVDLLEKSGDTIKFEVLSDELGIPVVPVSVRNHTGLDQLKNILCENIPLSLRRFYSASALVPAKSESEQTLSEYQHFLCWVEDQKQAGDTAFDQAEAVMIQDVLNRYTAIDQMLEKCLVRKSSTSGIRQKADQILLHPVFGYVIFLALLGIMFQAVFAWAEWPMAQIENVFAGISDSVAQHFPEGIFSDLIRNGILAGIGGVVVFIPQIAFLFLFIAILEESGYMARVVYLMDRIMRYFGMNGRSVIPLIGGMACAIPSIMSARGIPDKKERLITILVTPLMSCSARIPVYTLLISLVIPEYYVLGVMNLRGLVMLGLYLLGFLMALLVAWILKSRLKDHQQSFFLVELPLYRWPRVYNMLLTVWHKCKAFVLEAGKIILMISIVLWFLVSYGPDAERAQVIAEYENTERIQSMSEEEIEMARNADLLEVSYAGYLGKMIEPVIRPLGFDWKMGIGLIASFAAREVFVGTMATIYAASDSEENPETLKERMLREVHQDTGLPVYTLASGFALILFYAFAMQCMSTLAIARRETGSWKWTAFMLIYLTLLAYAAAWVAFVSLS